MRTMSLQEMFQQFIDDRKFTENDIKLMGLEAFEADDIRRLMGGRAQRGVVIPYFDFNGRATRFRRVRYLGPLGDKNKYMQKRGSKIELYYSRNIDWGSVKNRVDIPIIITEGEFKAYVVNKHINEYGLKLACIGLGGVANWRDYVEDQFKHHSVFRLHQTLQQFRLRTVFDGKIHRRQVYILFDYDGPQNGITDVEKLKPEVGHQEALLMKLLQENDAVVTALRLGRIAENPSKKYAIDDCLYNDHFLMDVIEHCQGATVNQLSEKMSNFIMFSTLLVFEKTNCRYFNMETKRFMTTEGLANLTAPYKHDAPLPANAAAGAVPKRVPSFKAYTEWDKRPVANGVVMAPEYIGQSYTPDGAINICPRWGLEPEEGDVSLYLNFLDKFIGDREMVDYVVKWYAWILQRPHQRTGTILEIISSAQGIGKSVFIKIHAEIMNGCRVEDIRQGLKYPASKGYPGMLNSDFNSTYAGSLYVFVDELNDMRVGSDNRLKGMATDEAVTVNEKFQPQYYIRNCCNYAITTNAPFVTRMSDESRRDVIIYPRPTNNDKPEMEAIIDGMMDWLHNDNMRGARAVMYYLMCEVDLSGFNPLRNVPKTLDRQSAINRSKTDAHLAVDALVRHVEESGGMLVLTQPQLRALFDLYGGSGVKQIGMAINKHLPSQYDSAINQNTVVRTNKLVFNKTTGQQEYKSTPTRVNIIHERNGKSKYTGQSFVNQKVSLKPNGDTNFTQGIVKRHYDEYVDKLTEFLEDNGFDTSTGGFSTKF